MVQKPLQGSHSNWKTWKSWKMKMVMEKSWNMRNLQNVRESCDQSGILPILSLNFTKCVTFLQTFRNLATVKKVNGFS